jgi:hypothetical protein
MGDDFHHPLGTTVARRIERHHVEPSIGIEILDSFFGLARFERDVDDAV